MAVGGWIASGKSTVARSLVRELGAELFSADEIRAEFAALNGDDAYVPGFSPVVYDEAFRRAKAVLAAGGRVVLDGTFRSRRLRDAARELAREHGAQFRLVECRAGEAACRQRLRDREAAGEEGWSRMLDHFLPLWEPADELAPDEHIVLDTSGRTLARGAPVLNISIWLREVVAPNDAVEKPR